MGHEERARDIIFAEGHVVSGGYENLKTMIAQALREVEAETIERCAREAEVPWKAASNRAPDWLQNSLSHGCNASAAAIRALKSGGVV